MNSPRNYLGGGGIQTSALAFGGQPAPARGTFTESWNGTSWSEVNDLSVGRSHLTGTGLNNGNALAALGASVPATSEEWSVSGGTQTISTS